MEYNRHFDMHHIEKGSVNSANMPGTPEFSLNLRGRLVVPRLNYCTNKYCHLTKVTEADTTTSVLRYRLCIAAAVYTFR